MVIIGIAGGTCSGKTTLSDRVRTRLGNSCSVLPLDNYYLISELPFEERSMLNHDLPESIDWSLLREHINQLAEGHPVDMPVYNFHLHKRSDQTKKVIPAHALIIEGIHAWHDPEIRRLMDLKIFLDSTADQRRQRRIKRDLKERCPDLEFVIKKYEKQTEATFIHYEQHYKSTADIVMDNPDEAENHIIKVLS